MFKCTSMLLAVSLLLQNTCISEERMERFAEKSISFAFDLYNHVTQGRDGQNIILSPLSIQTAAAIAYTGASHYTATEMFKGLHLVSNDRNIVAEVFHTFVGDIQNNPTLQMANKFFVQADFDVKREFLKIIENYFNSEVENINFSNNIEAATIMNNWIEKHTNGKIKEMIRPEMINSLARAYIINAIHFKDQWVTKFSKDKTKKRPFHYSKDESYDVDMMQNTASFNTAFDMDLKAHFVELPFKHFNLSFVAVIPIENNFEEFETKFLRTDVRKVHKNFSQNKISLFLPRFKAQFETSLKETFEKMGMTTMFSSSAEFPYISDESLLISDVVHKAFIEVNEEGAQAAASTGIGLNTRSGIMQVVANKPFIYYIKGSQGEIYFMGRFVKPSN